MVKKELRADATALAGLMEKALEYLNSATSGQDQIHNFFAKFDPEDLEPSKERAHSEVVKILQEHAEILEPNSEELKVRCSELADLVVSLLFSEDVLKLIKQEK